MRPPTKPKLLVPMCAVLCVALLLITQTANADTLDLDISSETTYFEANQDITVELEDDGYNNASIAFESTNNDEGPFELEKSGSTWSYDWTPEESGQYTIKLYVNGNVTSCDPDKITVYHEGYSAELETPWFFIFLIPGLVILGIIMAVAYLITKKKQKEASPGARRPVHSKITQPPPPFRPYRGPEPYVFVSYSHKDSERVHKVLKWLYEEGIHVWYDERISPGSEWAAEIENAILNCCVFMVFISPNSIQSGYVKKEINLAMSEDIPRIIIDLEETELKEGTGLRFQLGSYQILKLTDGNFKSKVLQQIRAEINKNLNP